MARFTLRQLECFRAVAENGTFHAAAAELFISPTAVANAVRQLERELGTQLCLPRRAQGVTLTAAGLAVLAHARSLLRDADELAVRSGTGGGPLTGPLSIGCYSTLAPTVLPELLQAYGERHPGVDVTFVDGAMPELHPSLLRGLLDVVVTYRISLPDDLEEVELAETDVHVLLSADHRLASAESVSLRDLRTDPLIMLDIAPSGRHTLDMLQNAGVRPRIAHRTSSFELVRSLVARGLGYSLLVQKPRSATSYEGLPLVAKRISPELSREVMVAVWPAGVRPTARTQALVDLAKEILGGTHE